MIRSSDELNDYRYRECQQRIRLRAFVEKRE